MTAAVSSLKQVLDRQNTVFFDEQVQLGTPAADVWTDPDNRLHIVIRDFRTARYRITDYVYDEGEKTFSGTAKMDYDGINYWGSLDF